MSHGHATPRQGDGGIILTLFKKAWVTPAVIVSLNFA